MSLANTRVSGLVCIGVGVLALGCQRGLWLSIVATVVCAMGCLMVFFG